jgi:hypothetical protein
MAQTSGQTTPAIIDELAFEKEVEISTRERRLQKLTARNCNDQSTFPRPPCRLEKDVALH